ncbi:arginase-1 [Episyrphus balteatus]|uniref:arginase-1 n=1 Tax=Episyrphus balteatus TaxID=286459 RepID=UPI002486B97E|nr:arginase-1 [Episyrphus balteatus]
MLLNSFKNVRNIGRFSHVASKSLGIIGVPFCKGQEKNGVEETPRILRKAGLIDILQERILVNDYGDLEIQEITLKNKELQNMKNYGEFQGCSISLIQKVQDILKENDVYLAIGGDHSIGFGSIAGHLQVNPNTSVIWIDAHPDINLNTTSVSGNIHGMPVALLIQEVRRLWAGLNVHEIGPVGLPAKELVYIGLRDIDPYEAYILKKLGIKFFSMDAVDKYGIAKILEMSLDAINSFNKLHISFDIDALDISIAPSTGTPVLGGLTLREGMYIMESLCETNRIEGVDFVELNPKIGTQHQSESTLSAGLEIIKSIFGYKRSGNICSKLKMLDL